MPAPGDVGLVSTMFRRSSTTLGQLRHLRAEFVQVWSISGGFASEHRARARLLALARARARARASKRARAAHPRSACTPPHVCSRPHDARPCAARAAPRRGPARARPSATGCIRSGRDLEPIGPTHSLERVPLVSSWGLPRARLLCPLGRPFARAHGQTLVRFQPGCHRTGGSADAEQTKPQENRVNEPWALYIGDMDMGLCCTGEGASWPIADRPPASVSCIYLFGRRSPCARSSPMSDDGASHR